MATTHDHSALIRNIQLATGVTTVAATGLLAASAHMLFRFAIDTQWKHSIFEQDLLYADSLLMCRQRIDSMKMDSGRIASTRRRIYMPSACMAIPEPLKNKPNGHTAMPAWASPSSHHPNGPRI